VVLPLEREARIATAAPPPPAELAPGAWLGRYQLQALLGQGGMGTVFRARDCWLGREVAIKVLNAATRAQCQAEQRFRREALAAAAVNHRNVAQVFDFVPAVGRCPAHLVGELVAGCTVRRFLDGHGGRVSPEIAGLIGGQLARALEAVHAAGIVHRDVKPDNVLLARMPGGAGRVVLTDFGVADGVGLPALAMPGARVGSPAYMSPEQERGEAVSPASDQWALGLLLFEMTTGRLPVAPGRRGLDPALAQAFEDICARCLRPRPQQRHPSVTVLARRLDRFCRTRRVDASDLGRALVACS
jgi:serine/threonine protein kinase